MKKELKDALYMLENVGYNVRQLNETSNIVDTIKAKYDRWEELRNTPEGDDLWDELVDTYGYELVDLVSDEYDAIKAGEPVDMTGYLRNADALYPEFFELLSKVNVTAFKINVKEAFGGNAYYLYQVLAEGKVQLRLDAYSSESPAYAFFLVKN